MLFSTQVEVVIEVGVELGNFTQWCNVSEPDNYQASHLKNQIF